MPSMGRTLCIHVICYLSTELLRPGTQLYTISKHVIDCTEAQ